MNNIIESLVVTAAFIMSIAALYNSCEGYKQAKAQEVRIKELLLLLKIVETAERLDKVTNKVEKAEEKKTRSTEEELERIKEAIRRQ